MKQEDNTASINEGTEEEEDDDEKIEEEEEPKLKYQRLGSTVAEILKQDAASCMKVHERFLALGTHWGSVLILDFNGNEIRNFKTVHTAKINEIALEDSGEWIASCSDDGKVVINALYSQETMDYSYHRPVLSVALDPDFHKKKNKTVLFRW